jgi:Rod binding domain-containing protein
METSLKPVFQVDSSRELEVQKKRLLDSCREFESVMISYMMKTMRDGVSWGEEPSSAMETYQDMFTQQVAREVSRSSVMGIGDMLYSKLEPLLNTKPPGNGDISAVGAGAAVPTSRDQPPGNGDIFLNSPKDSAD